MLCMLYITTIYEACGKYLTSIAQIVLPLTIVVLDDREMSIGSNQIYIAPGDTRDLISNLELRNGRTVANGMVCNKIYEQI